MKCECGSEIEQNDKLVYCPQCGWSFTIELIKKLYEFLNGK